MLSHSPRLSEHNAAALGRELYGLDGVATALTSERDQNFLLTAKSGERIVLKIANAAEDPAFLRMQQRVLDHLAPRFPFAPRVVPTVSGATLGTVNVGDMTHHVWAVTHLPGASLGGVRHRSRALLHDFGRTIGALSDALADFDDSALHREFYWDLARGRDVIARHRPLVSDADLGATIDQLVERFERLSAPFLPQLRRSALHNDLNDHNILVNADGDPLDRHQRVTGIVDLGDMVWGWTVGDLAIAAAYIAIGADDPLSDVAALARGCHETFPLDEAELGALFGLMILRLCTSVCVAEHQRRERADNAYLGVSQEAIRRALPVLARIPFGLAEAAFRSACGLAPSSKGARLRTWLAANTSRFAPVLGVDVRTEPFVVLDFSVESALVRGDARENAEPALTARVFGAMREAGARVGIGRWNEPRLLYVAPEFESRAAADERRTIHLGLDLFAEAGMPVHAPLDGVVHAFHDNATRLDYGPVIILRHATDDGTEFFTLYGHLSRESLEGLEIGKRIARGECFATIGTPDVNVGWTPHLHLQVITDLLDLGTDYPGVGAASLREVWCSLSPDPNLVVGAPSERLKVSHRPVTETRAARERLTAPNLRLSYREPLRVVRGWKEWLYDDEGRRYLDAYNNVPHVGHAHPQVVRAAAEQMSVLSTNTRYLNDLFNEYTSRLAATCPEPLRVVFLLNSASEANELALRLARAYTGGRDVIVLEDAYHGNTNAMIDVSPYKHAGPGGRGAPDWVHVAPLPDDYRGAYPRGDTNAGEKYAAHVEVIVRTLAGHGRRPAAFLAETWPSVGGQIVAPPGFLASAYAHVRRAGGLCIADEVQTGLGRIGTHFWAFESQDVVPDIVVAGKPLGNGHPIAAVITTRAIADAFDPGMEFFSTFGGNTVSCAVGMAVLDVLRDEDLQAHALRVGERLLASLRELAARHALIGDVRGSGLFLGVELVRDRETLEPAGPEAAYAANRMRELGVLIGTEGRHDNVLKIRPPMPFDADDADRLVAVLDRALRELS